MAATQPDDALLRLSDQKILPDRRIQFKVERQDGQWMTVSCLWEEVSDIVQFLCLLAKDASEQSDLPEGPESVQPYLVPLPATGIAFAAGSTADETLLVIRVGRYLALSFPIPNSDLVRLADEFSRTAVTLSAPTSREN